MLKTIKVKKDLRLDELIKYIFDNGIEDKVFPSNGGSSFDMCEVRVSGSGNIKMSGYINEHTTFTVEVEDEIDYDTIFEEVYRVTKEGYVTSDENKSINECLDWKDYQVQIFAMLDGKLQLIWEAKD